jgi:AraC family transcriptional regulator
MAIKSITRESYQSRVERVLEFLLKHPGSEPDLHRLAEEAFFSPFHFHRVYVAMMGESVAETVRRQRLHNAALALTASSRTLATIASDAGYGNAQAFARAFRAGYGVTPAAYRKHGQTTSAIQRAAFSNNTVKGSKAMFALSDVKVVTRENTRVYALRHEGDYQQIGATFGRLVAWLSGRDVASLNARSFGIYYDDPISKPASELVSDACIAAPPNAKADGDVRVMEIPAARCATFLFTGPYSELDKPYRWLYDTWLPQSGQDVGNHPPYEEYLNDARTTPPARLQTLICIPLND